MPLPVTTREVRDLQNAVQSLGQWVTYLPAAGATSRTLKARARYLNAAELANAIEAYPLEVTFDARDFTTAPPYKGDSVMIDGARRGVMLVREIRASGYLVAFRCGVQG